MIYCVRPYILALSSKHMNVPPLLKKIPAIEIDVLCVLCGRHSQLNEYVMITIRRAALCTLDCSLQQNHCCLCCESNL